MDRTDPVIFVVDDDRSVRESLHRLLTSVGMSVEVFPTAQAFLGRPRPDTPGCVVLDVRLPGLSGLDLQRELAGTDAPLPIVFITGHGDIPMSVRAMKAGAVEFLTKPFREQELQRGRMKIGRGQRISDHDDLPGAVNGSRRLPQAGEDSPVVGFFRFGREDREAHRPRLLRVRALLQLDRVDLVASLVAGTRGCHALWPRLATGSPYPNRAFHFPEPCDRSA